MAKTKQKNIRPSKAALDHLAFIVGKTGVNETAAIEMALAMLAQSLRGKKPAPKKGKEPDMYSYRNQIRIRERAKAKAATNGGKYAGTTGEIIPIE